MGVVPCVQRRETRQARGGEAQGHGAQVRRAGHRVDRHGRIAYVEIKAAGTLSPAPKTWRDVAATRGARFYVVSSVEEMADVLEMLGIRCGARAMA